MSCNPSLNWGNLKIMPFNDLKLSCPAKFLLTSSIFLPSFSSNLLYLFDELQQKNMLPILDMRAGMKCSFRTKDGENQCVPDTSNENDISVSCDRYSIPRSCQSAKKGHEDGD